jgi:hypothetical protein
MRGVPTPRINGHYNYEFFWPNGYGNRDDYSNSMHCMCYGYLIASLKMSPSFRQHVFYCSLINLRNIVLYW